MCLRSCMDQASNRWYLKKYINKKNWLEKSTMAQTHEAIFYATFPATSQTTRSHRVSTSATSQKITVWSQRRKDVYSYSKKYWILNSPFHDQNACIQKNIYSLLTDFAVLSSPSKWTAAHIVIAQIGTRRSVLTGTWVTLVDIWIKKNKQYLLNKIIIFIKTGNVGFTTRHWFLRIDVHLLPSLAIDRHLKVSCNSGAGEIHNNFCVLRKCRWKLHCLIHEILFIRK